MAFQIMGEIGSSDPSDGSEGDENPRPVSLDTMVPPAEQASGPIARGPHGRFAKGWRGGPGRPRGGLIDYARSRTDDGKLLIDHAVEVLVHGKVTHRDPTTG